jgi:hypothetical protein
MYGTDHIIVNLDIYDAILNDVPCIGVISIASLCCESLGVFRN